MSSGEATLRTIQTQIPARLDCLPWTRFHWRIVVGLGTVWILDGLEVTIVGAIGARLIEHGSEINMNAGDIGSAAAIYAAGACFGALFFGQLTDRFGRRKLMMITLAVYIPATVATAFAFAPWYFFLCRSSPGRASAASTPRSTRQSTSSSPRPTAAKSTSRSTAATGSAPALGGLAALLFLDTSRLARDFGWRAVAAARQPASATPRGTL